MTSTLSPSPGECLARRAIELEARPRRLGEGIWYAEDYHAAMMREGKRLTGWAVVPGRAPGHAWLRTGRYDFVLKPNYSASLALDEFLAGLTLTECTIWTIAVQYATVRDVLGEETFDALFGSGRREVPERQRLQLTMRSRNPVDYFFTRFNQAPLDALRAGDHLYYGGVPGYLVKHPIGVAQGWNVICTGHTLSHEPLYIGLGLEHPLSQAELHSYLVEAYNVKRHPIETWMARFRPRKFSLARRQLKEEIDDAPGATQGFTWMRRFRDVAFSTLREGTDSFSAFCAART